MANTETMRKRLLRGGLALLVAAMAAVSIFGGEAEAANVQFAEATGIAIPVSTSASLSTWATTPYSPSRME